LPIQRQILAVDTRTLFGGYSEGEDGSFDFTPRRLDRLSRLLSQSVGKLFFALGNALSNPPEHALSLKRRQSSGRAKGFDGGSDGRVDVFAPPLKHATHNGPVVGSSNFNVVAFLYPFTIEEECSGCDGSGSHLSHGVILAPPPEAK
jgi:hypothetical protein